jgi:hypothetical protein
MLADAQRMVADAVLAAGGHVGVAREHCVRVLRVTRAAERIRPSARAAALRNYDRC